MAVDFYSVNDVKRTQTLFSLNDNDFDYLRDIFSKFKKLTGIEIDKYGKTRISNQHVQLIANLLESEIKETSIDSFSQKGFQLLESMRNINDDLIAVGD